ncbi:ribose-phosphate pyrophosphokinase [Hypnocyclicus thermotrophus]|uniref:Ribose-phosphate pyrophosphokinase n=1 Tax=Hypnocyclicus thermotrophus TaxID=1627895 RepID=A0AA46DXB3_9FUSO|nr:ribose-phosphate diphosphokinase [Hypnocyclicus thermotrophus]TDT68008.1 ribose-phosphate pyrophosphokinase [Hypnocyclicus thermotrophus]
MRTNDVKVFSGSSNKELATKIAHELGIELGDAKVVRFKDGEVYVKLNETVRGDTVLVVQSTSEPVNENLMELLVFIDALKRASAKEIIAVMPYYGYARQDRKASPREPITAKLVANLLTTAGATRVITMDLHAQQIQGFFDIPVDHMKALPILAKYFLDKGFTGDDIVVVSPDVGGVKRARGLASWLDCKIAIIDKRRPKPNESEVMNIIGEIDGKIAIFIDDMIDTAGTITNGAQAVMDRGAKEVYACCTHAVFSGPAIDRLQESPLKEVVISDSIQLSEDKRIDKVTILSVSKLFSEGIRRVINNESLSSLFVKQK